MRHSDLANLIDFDEHSPSVRGALFDREGGQILSWSDDAALRLWDATTGKQIGAAMKHEGSVDGATFSKDERRILSWSQDNTVRLWDTATGQQIGPAMKHKDAIFGAAFDREGRQILTWSNDGKLRRWDASWHGINLFEIACNHAPQPYDLMTLSKRFGVTIDIPICEYPGEIPLPNWTTIEAAPKE